MNTQPINEMVRELRQELQSTKKKVKELGATDLAQLYYNGVIVGLQVSISKYEKWLYNVQPNVNKRKRGKG